MPVQITKIEAANKYNSGAKLQFIYQIADGRDYSRISVESMEFSAEILGEMVQVTGEKMQLIANAYQRSNPDVVTVRIERF